MSSPLLNFVRPLPQAINDVADRFAAPMRGLVDAGKSLLGFPSAPAPTNQADPGMVRDANKTFLPSTDEQKNELHQMVKPLKGK